jgi:hypothetical protein
MTTKLVMQRIIKGIPHTEEEDKCNHENRGENKSH